MLDLPVIEEVQPGEKGTQRQRKDKRLKRYLQAKRPLLPQDLQRCIGYRTEACLGYNRAHDDGAPQEVLEALEREYEWALEQMRAAGITPPEDSPHSAEERRKLEEDG